MGKLKTACGVTCGKKDEDQLIRIGNTMYLKSMLETKNKKIKRTKSTTHSTTDCYTRPLAAMQKTLQH
jgi:hypothetical protein